ncbi:unnamed protein product [Diamesa serratosioi]
MPSNDDQASQISIIRSNKGKSEGRSKIRLKVEKLKEENTKLQESLDERNKEVAHLNDTVASLNNSINLLHIECSSISTAKVVDLSKKNRKLFAELQVTRSKLILLEGNFKELEKQLDEKTLELKQECQLNTDLHPPPQNEIQNLTDKLNQSKQKLFEVLNNNSQLKNELKIAHKCIQLEVGEPVNVAQLMSSNSNWRGRAQQIAILHSKISDLREKLENTNFDSFEMPRLPVKRLESMRKLEVDSLNKELDEAKSNLENNKQKLVALKTRNKNLGDEANNYKLKTLELLEKSARDESHIQLLNEQISINKYECNHKMEQSKKQMEQNESLNQEAQVEVQRLKYHLQNQKDTMLEKDHVISCLKETINSLELNLKDVSSDFLFSCRQMNKDQYICLLETLEQEKRDILKYVKELNDRLNSESLKVSNQHDVISKQKLRLVRSEAKLKEYEDEKESTKFRNRRVLRINEYSRTVSGSSINIIRPMTRSIDKINGEIDKLKSKLEISSERNGFLENKIRQLKEEKMEDGNRFCEIISKSKEVFKDLFDVKDSRSCKQSPAGDF